MNHGSITHEAHLTFRDVAFRRRLAIAAIAFLAIPKAHELRNSGGSNGTRTRGLLRDRQVL